MKWIQQLTHRMGGIKMEITQINDVSIYYIQHQWVLNLGRKIYKFKTINERTIIKGTKYIDADDRTRNKILTWFKGRGNQ